MSLSPALPVSDVIAVNVTASAAAIPPLQFNQGLIVGSSAVIPSYGPNARLQQYPSLAAMLASGFNADMPEYLAAELYFSQNPAPQFVWIGRQDLTAISTAIPHSGSAGTGYVVGDVIGVTQGGATHGLLTVTGISAGGVVTSLGTTIGNQGTGYSVATALVTTGGTGTGLEVDITAVGESLLQAVEACILVNNTDWYEVMCCGAADADHLALAAYSSANWQTLFYFGSSADAAIPAGTAGNLFLQVQAANYKAFLSYNTTQSGLFPNNIYAAAAYLGQAAGLNTGAPNSAFTLNLKQLVGVGPEPLTQAQYTAIINANGNTCVSYGAYIGYGVRGVCSDGTYFDQYLNRAMLVNLIQTNEMNLLIGAPKVAQTNADEQLLLNAVDAACAAMATIGYIGPGVWDGASVQFGTQIFLANGQSLPLGYISGAPSYATQSSGNRAARQAMPITCCILEAGAVHSVVVNVFTQL